MTAPLTCEQEEKLNAFLGYLEKWNKVHNLTTIPAGPLSWQKHIEDCLMVLPFLRKQRVKDVGVKHEELRASAELGPQLDMGSGAGLPGMVMAIMQPDVEIHLAEKVAKKAVFLEQAAGFLGLGNVVVDCVDLGRWQTPLRFQAITARAFAAPETVLGLASIFLAPEGRVVLMLARQGIEEKHLPPGWGIAEEAEFLLSGGGDGDYLEGCRYNPERSPAERVGKAGGEKAGMAQRRILVLERLEEVNSSQENKR